MKDKIPSDPTMAFVKGFDEGAQSTPDLRKLAPLAALVIANEKPISLGPEDFEFIMDRNTTAGDIARRWPARF